MSRAAVAGSVVEFRPRAAATRLRCSSCGADGSGSCDCGAPYLPAGKRAEEAIAASPEKSDRAIAEEIGVDHKTVSKARKRTGDQSPVAKRTGRDGKKRKAPKTKAKAATARKAPVADAPENRRVNHITSVIDDAVTDYVEQFNAWLAANPNLSQAAKDSIILFLHTNADKLLRLAQALDGR